MSICQKEIRQNLDKFRTMGSSELGGNDRGAIWETGGVFQSPTGGLFVARIFNRIQSVCVGMLC